MDFQPNLLLQLLRDLSEAINLKKSGPDYSNLLHKIFEDRDFDNTKSIAPVFRADDELSQVFGRDQEKEQLLSQLLDLTGKTFMAAPSSSATGSKEVLQLDVIPILGMGGIGKTTLARLVYDNQLVKENFSLRVWVRVGGQELILHHAAQGILKSASGISCSLDDLDELDEMVRDTLQSHRCLIVFDEIESMDRDSWLHMNQCWFNVVGLGSKVLMITPGKDVANLVANQPFELTQLSDDAGWSMCRYIAFDSEKGGNVDALSLIARNVAILCRGIPLLLRLTGCLMRYDKRLCDMLYAMGLFGGDLMPFWDESVVVLLSIWALPQHLRQCFALCAVFPKGYVLKKVKIIAMWIAHGLVKASPGNNINLEDIGNAYLHQLLCRSFFTDVTFNEYGDIVEFQIPRLVYRFMEDVARVICKDQLGLIGSIGEDAAELSLVSPHAEKCNSEQLRILTLSPIIYLDGILDQSLLEFRRLWSLDLSCSGIQNLSDDICALKELRYLNLSYTLIERLPDSITELSLLQSLDLSCCFYLKVIPEGMRNLMDLRHLDLSLCESLAFLPYGIGLLVSLSSMPLFVLSKDHDCARLGELQSLNQLRGRLEIRNLENVREISEARDAKLDQKNLSYLGLSWSQNDDDGFGIFQYLQPSPQLKFLDITGYMGIQFPLWISSISGLIKISINNCGAKKLPALGQLPLLKELQLKRMTKIERIGPEFYGYGVGDVFPSLEQLELCDMPQLLEWSSASPSGSSVWHVFPSLKTLTVEGGYQLLSLPSLPTLLDLIVWNCKSEILSSLASFRSLSSLLVNDVKLGSFFDHLSRLNLLKKLVLFNIKDVYVSSHLFTSIFFALEHLSILHCHRLRAIRLYNLSSLEKLHIIDCQELEYIRLGPRRTPLVEFVIEDCPLALYIPEFPHLPSLRKLTIKSCREVDISLEEFKQLEKLEYLFISRCILLHIRLQMNPSVVSHVSCVILENPEVEHMRDKDDNKDIVELESDETASVQLSIAGASNESLKSPKVVQKRPKRKSRKVLTKIKSCFSTSHMSYAPEDASRLAAQIGSATLSVSLPRSPPVSGANPSISKDNNNAAEPFPRRLFSACYRRRKPKNDIPDEEDAEIHIRKGREFSLRELQVATDKFSQRNVLLRDGCSKLYKGRLADGSLVAVRRFNQETGQGAVPRQFQTEVEVINIAVHRNLIHLLGYCITSKELLLVYPFMVNGSVASCLRERPYSQPPLNWSVRRGIALGSARGLAYLHEGCPQKIIHRDVKAANILLNEDFEAVIAGFEIAKLGDHNDTEVTTAVRGTIGHIAPEYLSTGRCSEKTDVFAYGVFLFELITGQRVFDLARVANNEDLMLLDWVEGLLREKKLERIVDADLQGDYMDDDVEQAIQLALLCTQSNPEERPKMSEIVMMLAEEGGKCLAERWERWQNKEEILSQHLRVEADNWLIDSPARQDLRIDSSPEDIPR